MLSHRYDDPPILAGQGTAALEIIEQMDDEGVTVDAVVIPVGGGGLLAGMSVTLKNLLPKVKVIVSAFSLSYSVRVLSCVVSYRPWSLKLVLASVLLCRQESQCMWSLCAVWLMAWLCLR